ncbi:major structural protein [Simian hemorrhagic fever virus]|uniref:Major structural protein n=3 Tax=Simian hemorrhagic fever virus TaxID=38143 RepID=Q87063_SHFV|nr:major structural protein [Simian hemorrhagic fever virus]AAB63399.1 major structural protein [Simian hemorrhagic fever virus]AIL48093.1 N protein [Simian hemorrhagic fever virus]AIL48108.1 N protein [Simian hemorrhagic fever virus]AIL48123.1 N protein [Simian hemorrhagic fever virus]AIL48138.1 N protein [Simian hemorrhagic fever virus]
MAGKPKTNNKGKSQSRGGNRLPQRPRRSTQQRRAAPVHKPLNETHYVFAEPGDLRVVLPGPTSAHIKQLLIRYYDNGGGNLSYDGQRINFAAIITPPHNMLKQLAKVTSST